MCCCCVAWICEGCKDRGGIVGYVKRLVLLQEGTKDRGKGGGGREGEENIFTKVTWAEIGKLEAKPPCGRRACERREEACEPGTASGRSELERPVVDIIGDGVVLYLNGIIPTPC